ncbi:hypothetical protein Ddye_007948 [Dipteronia dyeriana]|uniref:Uncharacterized protein n=1 Tax=Dipteronia dyeriana TaxID=168575 RepID=A0AAD9XLG6_9ROSI|nr:hypothetical protein Ddye_007948 [Dipteronia dyeriana]
MKRAIRSYAFAERFEYKVSRYTIHYRMYTKKLWMGSLVRKLPITSMAEFVRDLLIRFKGVSINAIASDLYTIEFLKHAYEMGINSVPDLDIWGISNAIRNSIVLPWKKKNLPERPMK